jgi:hypothetical protein
MMSDYELINIWKRRSKSVVCSAIMFYVFVNIIIVINCGRPGQCSNPDLKRA